MEEIKRLGREHLATNGAAALSVRAIARELGMVSSGIYRYVRSRDELLTLLITDAYNSLGAAAEAAEAAVDRSDLRGRFLASGRAVRRWAVSHTSEYALVFGSPVPGYAAPQDTIGPALRVPALLAGILVDAAVGGRISTTSVRAVAGSPAALREMRSMVPDVVPDDVLVRGAMAWVHVFGAISFELFGHLGPSPTEPEMLFDVQLDLLADLVGLVA
jgi:AcrR family transcriptional regulator